MMRAEHNRGACRSRNQWGSIHPRPLPSCSFASLSLFHTPLRCFHLSRTKIKHIGILQASYEHTKISNVSFRHYIAFACLHQWLDLFAFPVRLLCFFFFLQQKDRLENAYTLIFLYPLPHLSPSHLSDSPPSLKLLLFHRFPPSSIIKSKIIVANAIFVRTGCYHSSFVLISPQVKVNQGSLMKAPGYKSNMERRQSWMERWITFEIQVKSRINKRQFVRKGAHLYNRKIAARMKLIKFIVVSWCWATDSLCSWCSYVVFCSQRINKSLP